MLSAIVWQVKKYQERLSLASAHSVWYQCMQRQQHIMGSFLFPFLLLIQLVQPIVQILRKFMINNVMQVGHPQHEHTISIQCRNHCCIHWRSCWIPEDYCPTKVCQHRLKSWTTIRNIAHVLEFFETSLMSLFLCFHFFYVDILSLFCTNQDPN